MLYFECSKQRKAPEHIMARRPRVDLVEIDGARINDVSRLYFIWKDLNIGLRNFVSRGINFPEAISEPMACYALGYSWNKGSGGDAVTPDGRIVEMKASSNFDGDLSSFGPETTFDELYFLRLHQRDNHLYIYNLNLNGEELGNLAISRSQTVRDQQLQGRRPRFSIIKQIIEPYDLQPELIFDIRTMQVLEPEEVDIADSELE